MCPPRVTGDLCDSCLPLTFGFDALIGCEDCDCDVQGVANGNMACDVSDGQCECRLATTGRRCDECASGFYDFPRCGECICDRRGTVDRVCDQYSGRCMCKVICTVISRASTPSL